MLIHQAGNAQCQSRTTSSSVYGSRYTLANSATDLLTSTASAVRKQLRRNAPWPARGGQRPNSAHSQPSLRPRVAQPLIQRREIHQDVAEGVETAATAAVLTDTDATSGKATSTVTQLPLPNSCICFQTPSAQPNGIGPARLTLNVAGYSTELGL
jgi:hypothetical protein